MPCATPLENHVTGTAVALGPEDDVVRSWQAAHPAYRLRSFRGKRLGRDLNQVNAFHDYVGHDPFIVVEEVVDLPHARRARITLGEVGHVVQRHDLGMEGRVIAEIDKFKVLAEWQTASVVAVVVLILVLVLGAGARDGSLEGGKVRRRRRWREGVCVNQTSDGVCRSLNAMMMITTAFGDGVSEHMHRLCLDSERHLSPRWMCTGCGLKREATTSTQGLFECSY